MEINVKELSMQELIDLQTALSEEETFRLNNEKPIAYGCKECRFRCKTEEELRQHYATTHSYPEGSEDIEIMVGRGGIWK